MIKTKKEKFTYKELAFINEFTKDFNGTQAAIRAGYSRKSAYSIASENLRKPEIAERIKERIGVEKFRTLAENSRLSKSDVRKLFRKNGTLKGPKEWDDETAAAVASLEVEETFTGQGKNRVWTGYLKKVRLWNKPQALETELRHLGQLENRLEGSGEERKRQRPYSGLTDAELNRKLVEIVCRLLGKDAPQAQPEVPIEGSVIEPPAMITEGAKPGDGGDRSNGKDILDELLEDQKKGKA